MKSPAYLKLLSLIAIVVLSIAPLVLAQKASDTKRPATKYDATSEVKLNGTIEEVKLDPAENEGTHVLLKSGGETILVHVGPPEFLKEYDVNLAKGDQITVVGSKLKIDGADELLAKEITKGDNTATLRDKKGVPVWQLFPKKR